MPRMLSDMSDVSESSPPPGQGPTFIIQRKRAFMACSNCRKRKIKCGNPNDENGHEPCERCLKRRLECQYVAVSEPPPPRSPKTSKNPQSRDTPGFHPSMQVHGQHPEPSYLSYGSVPRRDSTFGADHRIHQPRANLAQAQHFASPQQYPTYPNPSLYDYPQPTSTNVYRPHPFAGYNNGNNDHMKPEPGVDLRLSWEDGITFPSCAFCQGPCFCGQHPPEQWGSGQGLRRTYY